LGAKKNKGSSVRPLAFIAPKTLTYLAFQIFDLSVPDEGYSRNARPLAYIQVRSNRKFGKPNNLMFWEQKKQGV
jgi:hypothetical protein